VRELEGEHVAEEKRAMTVCCSAAVMGLRVSWRVLGGACPVLVHECLTFGHLVLGARGKTGGVTTGAIPIWMCSNIIFESSNTRCPQLPHPSAKPASLTPHKRAPQATALLARSSRCRRALCSKAPDLPRV